jgi:hypothetical protein
MREGDNGVMDMELLNFIRNIRLLQGFTHSGDQPHVVTKLAHLAAPEMPAATDSYRNDVGLQLARPDHVAASSAAPPALRQQPERLKHNFLSDRV